MNTDAVIYQKGRHPTEGKHPGFRPGARSVENGMLIERDIGVKLRDGTTIYVDVYRPANNTVVPAIIGWAPYGKHSPTLYEIFYDNAGVKKEWLSPYAVFEAPDPGYWVPLGYSVILVDARGTWYSEGTARFWNHYQEGLDGYDVIEWAAEQPWCTSKIGFTGVSYFAHTQWRIAEQRPPHLAAINPWEGFTDGYRDAATHGGIPNSQELWYETARFSVGDVENMPANSAAHPLFDDYWAQKVPDLSKIEVPAFVVSSWSDQGLHTRGTIDAFTRISSRDKWLYIHGQKKWANFHRPESMEMARCFFDHFLRGQDTDIKHWPPVLLEIRERYYTGATRAETAWPIPDTQYRKLFLDVTNRTLTFDEVMTAASSKYETSGPEVRSNEAYGAHRLEFNHVFAKRTELTGYMSLRLWVEAERSDDMDLFVALQKFDRKGNYVPFPAFAALEDGPVAMGWLRVSHRDLDEELSKPYRPWHTHTRSVKLKKGEIVPADIEIWPSGTLFEEGETLRLVIQGTDIYRYTGQLGSWCHTPNNFGAHIIHAGSEYDSHLLIPVIPERR